MALLDNVVSIQKRLAIILVVAVVLIVATVALLRVAIVRPITCAPNCIGANLLGSDLRGLDLARTNFVEANLQGADLRDANLRRVDLSGANLFNANLRNADLSEAQLIGTNLTGADLGGSLLSGANLTGAILNSADLTAVDLTEAALKGASFGEAKLTNAQLSDANLNGIQFAKANLSGAILDGATLSGANLSQVDLSGASLRAVDLTGSWLNIANLTGTDLSGADLSGSRLIGAQLTSANLSSGSLQGATVIGATLNGANLRGANVQQLRGLATQLQPDDLRLDPVLAELNELQQRDLRRDVEMQGLAFDAQTEWDSRFRPAEAAVATPTIIASTVGATDETGEATVAAGEAEKHVKINFYVNALRNAPAQPGAYEVDFTVDTFWNEPGVGEGEVSQMATDQFFDPFLEIVNAGQVQMLNHRYERSIEPGTTLRLRQRFVATFSPALDLRRFPFDRQTVSLQIESAEYDSESLQFDFAGLVEPMTQSEIPQVQSVPRGRYIDGSAVDVEWKVQEVNVVQFIRVLPYDNSAWSQFRVDVVVKRVAAGYLWRIWVLLAALWLLVGSVLLVDSSKLPVRLWLLFLLFCTAVAFQAIMVRVLPALNAFTLFDVYLLICYIAIVTMALLVLVMMLLHLRGQHRWARWVNRASVILYPTVFILVNLWLISGVWR